MNELKMYYRFTYGNLSSRRFRSPNWGWFPSIKEAKADRIKSLREDIELRKQEIQALRKRK